MKDKYDYLHDPRALAEIRKHQWIESQKTGATIGFASAAVDWIHTYGPEWKRMHVVSNNNFFVEKRKYRRFEANFACEMTTDKVFSSVESVNVSFFGLLFRTEQCIPLGSRVFLRLASSEREQRKVHCAGVVERVIEKHGYEVFLRFDDVSQREIEKWDYFAKLCGERQ